MRVWDGADPRLLNRKHLLAEHREVHALLNEDFPWGTNPEAVRFQGPRGKSLLILRHELLRVGMAVRWGTDRHGREAHAERARDPELHRRRVDLDLLSPRAQAALLLYERHALPMRRVTEPGPDGSWPPDEWIRPTPFESQAFFRRLMAAFDWPPCRLEGGATTPWHRDGIPASQYVRVGDAWNRIDFHHKAHLYPKGH